MSDNPFQLFIVQGQDKNSSRSTETVNSIHIRLPLSKLTYHFLNFSFIWIFIVSQSLNLQ